jgi:antitoxin MazE
MKIKVIKIGNSRGIRLPKVILHQIGITDEVDLEVERDRIILRPIILDPSKVRQLKN